MIKHYLKDNITKEKLEKHGFSAEYWEDKHGIKHLYGFTKYQKTYDEIFINLRDRYIGFDLDEINYFKDIVPLIQDLIDDNMVIIKTEMIKNEN